MDLYRNLRVGDRSYRFVDVAAVAGEGYGKLPLVLRLLLESHLRASGDDARDDVRRITADWLTRRESVGELVFGPNRLLMHDTTCTPALADVAGLKDALAESGGDPGALNPVLPVEVSVDHSLSVDHFARPDALERNSRAEIERNAERYTFLRWAAGSMDNLRVNPPGTGIMHTINLEQLATVMVIHADEDGGCLVHPDMLLGTDSHTPMVNGIGVLGWGVGGLEAESVMFGDAVSIAVPEIVGVRLVGQLPPGTLSTDLALVVTSRLRALGVAGSFVEFFGPGVSSLTADDRAVIANMAPEYGATVGYFGVDARTIAYLERTARPEELTSAIPDVFRAAGWWFDPAAEPFYSRQIEIDLSALRPTLAGPRRPQDLVSPASAVAAVEASIGRMLSPLEGAPGDGAVGVAAITSCTNTSDPRLLIAAGLLARKARAAGLSAQPWIKTSLAPGSPSAQDYLARAGLLEDLGAIGFDIVGFGCTTCIGNSGRLPEAVTRAQADGAAVVAVLSGNRNFPGRVHPAIDLGFLASPPMVVAYAILGTITADILSEPVGQSHDGRDIYLADLWPTGEEVEAAMADAFRPQDVPEAFARASANPAWAALVAPKGDRFPWDPQSRYLRRPKFASLEETSRLGDYEATPLMVLGDDITTDHISPASAIAPESEAGRWLLERGADPGDLNVFAAYRGNWEVMLRGLFTNRLVRNHLADDLPPGQTVVSADGAPIPLWQAAEEYRAAGRGTVILAGDLYGMGSSRDWAAKGVALLGIRAVIARSFERIHRTNLIGMGVLPIRILDSFDPKSAGLSVDDCVVIRSAPERLDESLDMTVEISRASGGVRNIPARADIATRRELDILKAGGILPAILQDSLGSGR
jgi:aconitate hydratase